MSFRRHLLLLGFLCFFFAGCGKKESTPAVAPGAKELTKVRFQTDWYAQAEHGGFYQAVAKGYYREAGLDVEILTGGPGPTIPQKVMGGAADIAMASSDSIMVYVKTGLPFVMIGAFMQHDPQAILVHAESSVKSFPDLNGKSVMANPGSNWIDYLKSRYRIEFNLIPMNYSLAQFMADENFVQQCFVTSEPYFVEKNGAKARTLLIADSGFDSYRTLFTTQRYLRENPKVVRAFAAATARGWEDFIKNDPSPAKALILKANPQMTEEIMDFSIQAMRQNHLIEGFTDRGEYTGSMTAGRLEKLMSTLLELKILSAPLPLEKMATFDFVPNPPAR